MKLRRADAPYHCHECSCDIEPGELMLPWRERFIEEDGAHVIRRTYCASCAVDLADSCEPSRSRS
jgi:hypothetical protein